MMNAFVIRRILNIGTAIAALAFLESVFLVLPGLREFNLGHSIHGNVYQFLLVVSVTHLIIIGATIYTERFTIRKGHLNYGFLITSGILLIIFCIMNIDLAKGYTGFPEMQSKIISISIWCGLDFISGLLYLAVRYLKGRLNRIK